MKTPSKICLKFALLLTVAAGEFLGGLSSLASSDMWVGNTDANWSTAANWGFSSGSAVNSSGDYLIFGAAGSSGAALNNDLSGYSFSGITFTNGAAAYTFSGNAITLAGGITNNASSVETDNLNMTLGANLTISAASGAVVVGGIIDDAGNGYGLTLAGSKSETFAGSNTYSGATLLISPATFTFSGTGSAANSAFHHGIQGSSTATYVAVSPNAAGTVSRTASYVYNGVALGGNNYHNFTINGTSAGNTVEQFGDLILNSGELEGTISANAAANVEVVFNSVTRQPGTTFYFGRSTSGIGGNPIADQVANAANIVFSTPPALSGGGGAAGSPNISILPWAGLGSGNRVTYDSTYGLRGLGTGETVALTAGGFVGSDGTTNVNTASVTLAGNSAVNSIGGGGTVGLGGYTLTVASGVIIAGTATTIGSTANDGFLVLGGEGHFFAENARGLTINSSISGTNGLTINLDDYNGTSASCTLAGTNTFSGVTTVEGNNAGMALNVNNALALQNSTLNYNNYGAKVNFGGSQTHYVFGGLEGAQNLAVTVPLTLGSDGDSTIYSGVLSGVGSLIKTGTGSFTLAAANTFSGGTTVSNGVLNINNGGSSSANSAIGTGALTIAGGTIDNTSGSPVTLSPNNAQNWNGNFTFNGSSSLNLGTGLVALGGNEQITVNSNILTDGGVISGSGDSLTKNGNGELLLTAAETYSGNTTISAGTFALSGGGSLASSPDIFVGNGATFDVSGTSSIFTLGASQSLYGAGTNNGSVFTSSGSQIYADDGSSYATNTFRNNLTLVSGATANFQLGAAANGANDLIVVGGNLVLNGNTINISAPSAGVDLASSDYRLFTVNGTVSGTAAASPGWVVRPLNYANYSIVTSGNAVLLHYQSAVLPSGTGLANPAAVSRGQSTLLSVTVTPGTYAINSVTVDATPIGGLASVSLVQSNASNVYTNTVTVGASVGAGSAPLTATITDGQGNTATASIALTVLPGIETWNGGSASDDNWNDTANWAGGTLPLNGDAVTFAGTTRLTPFMDTSFNLGSVTFGATAGAFVETNAPGALLTLSGGIANNSANSEALNMPIALASAQTISAAAGNIVLGGVVSGGSLIKTGTNALMLSGANTYGGGTMVNAGTVVLDNNMAVGSGVVTLNGGSISNAAGNTFTVANNVTVSSAAAVGVGAGDELTLSGTIGGVGNLGLTGGGSLVLPNANNLTGGVTVNAGTLVVGNNYAAGTGALTVSNASLANVAGNSYSLPNTVNLAGAAGVSVATNDELALNGFITNGGSLNADGSGTFMIGGSSPNAYSGGTMLSSGYLDIENTSASPLGTGPLSLAGGILENNGGTGITLTNSVVAVTNTTSYLHPTGINGNGIFVAGNLTGSGNIVVDGSASTYDSFVLAGNNSGFAGTLTVNQGGYQRFTFGSATAGSPNGSFVLNSVGTDNQRFTFGTGTISFGALSGAGTLRNDGGSSMVTLRVGDLNTNCVFSGSIVANGNAEFGVLKTGSGVFTLSGNNTYTGTNEVAEGTLELTDLQQTGKPLQVDDGATFAYMNTGSGNPVQVSSMVLGTNAGANLWFTNITYTAINVSGGTLTANGICVVTLADTANLYPGAIFPLISYTTFEGTGSFVLSPLPGGLQGSLINDPNYGGLLLSLPSITTPTNLTATVNASGGVTTLNVSWPGDHQGWVLETNNVGLNASNAWGIVSGSEYTTTESITVDPTQTNVFIRLALP